MRFILSATLCLLSTMATAQPTAPPQPPEQQACMSKLQETFIREIEVRTEAFRSAQIIEQLQKKITELQIAQGKPGENTKPDRAE